MTQADDPPQDHPRGAEKGARRRKRAVSAEAAVATRPPARAKAAPILPIAPPRPDPAAPELPVAAEIRACDLCAGRFAATATAHRPRPVVWFSPGARILVASQAPGARVHDSGRPFSDRSGERLREWMGVDDATFYDRSRIAIVPMAFCFPGYDAKGADLPPPPLCAETWRGRIMADLAPRVTLLVGGHAIRWHLGLRDVTAAVAGWREHAPHVFPLPHPSWRNTAWLKRNPWFQDELLPELRRTIAEVP